MRRELASRGRSKLTRQIRSNVLGLVAIFIALTGTAFALPGNNTVDSGDIINGQVRSPDVRADDLTSADLAFGAVTYSELAPSAFAAGDIARPGSPFATGYGIAPDAIQSAEVSANALTGADVNETSLDTGVLQRRIGATCGEHGIAKVNQDGSVVCDTLASARSLRIGDTGIICNDWCTEGSLELPAGTWALMAKITILSGPGGDDLTGNCYLTAGGLNDAADHFDIGGSAFSTTLPMTLVATLTRSGNAALNCQDSDVGDNRGSSLSITAIRVAT